MTVVPFAFVSFLCRREVPIQGPEQRRPLQTFLRAVIAPPTEPQAKISPVLLRRDPRHALIICLRMRQSIIQMTMQEAGDALTKGMMP